MRYTKTALLTFGAGLVLALAVVATETEGLARVASAVMALGIAAIPIGMAVDWHLATRVPRRPSRRPPRAAARGHENPRGRAAVDGEGCGRHKIAYLISRHFWPMVPSALSRAEITT